MRVPMQEDWVPMQEDWVSMQKQTGAPVEPSERLG